VISIDTKKKELIGNFSRDGHTLTQAPVDRGTGGVIAINCGTVSF
jgi:hypothetical protein